MNINIRLSEPGPFVMKIRAEGLPLKVAEINLPERPEDNFLLVWLLAEFRDYFDYLPLSESELTFSVGEKVVDRRGKEIKQFIAYIDRTSDAMDHMGPPINGDRSLFVNVSDDLRYGSLHSLINEQTPALYLNLDLGFDRTTREWTKNKVPFLSLGAFLRYLSDNKVGTIITVNQYLIDKYRHENEVLLIPVLKKLGVKLIRIENDPSDLRAGGFLMRYAYHVQEWPSFSNLYCLNHWWDTRNRNCNITPIAIPQDYRGSTRKLRDDYRIVMLSNSRWGSVQNSRNHIDRLFANMTNPWCELTVWYMAMRRMILNGDITEYQRLWSNSMLHQFFWMAAQDLKYQAIKAIKTDRPIDVYGDIGWKNVCPEYYRGSLSNGQINELFERDDVLLLLANCSFTYQDASGPVYDMIRRGCHWINLPVVAKTDGMKGLEAIEYDTPERLNELANDVKPAFEKAKDGLRFYRLILQNSVKDLVEGMHGRQSLKLYDWKEQLLLHDDKLNEVLDAYTDQNEVLLRASYRMFKA